MTKNAQIFHLQYFQPNYRQFYTSSTLHDHQFHHRFQPTLNIIKLCQDLSSNIMSDREATAEDVGFSFKGGRRNSKQVERSDKVFQHIKVEGKGREGKVSEQCCLAPNGLIRLNIFYFVNIIFKRIITVTDYRQLHKCAGHRIRKKNTIFEL